MRTISLLRLLSAAVLALLCSTTYAAEKDTTDILPVVLTWIRHMAATSRADASIEKIEPYAVEGKVVAFIVHLSGNGYCFAGADDSMLPVYLYSPEGKYDEKNPELLYFLSRMRAEYLALSDGFKANLLSADQSEAITARKMLWESLSHGRVLQNVQGEDEVGAAPQRMILPLTSFWHQDSPYNDQCPTATPQNVSTVVGCVATAMSQVMYYWKWPNSGSGQASGSYSWRERANWDETPLSVNPGISGGFAGRLQWTAANGGRLQMTGAWDDGILAEARTINASAAFQNALSTLWDRLNRHSQNYNVNFGQSTYNWQLIADQHSDPVDAGDAAVAQLCHHAGVSTHMDYGMWGSGAYVSDARNGLVNNFRFDTDMTGEEDCDINKMTSEIQWLRPVIIKGDDGQVGHAWVIYGYDKGTDPVRQFLLNLGWGRGSNAVWLSMDNVQFPNNLKHLTRIAPSEGVKFVGGLIRWSGDGSPSFPYGDISWANANAPAGTKLIFPAGATCTFLGTSLTINKPLTLEGQNVTIRSYSGE